MHNISFNIVQSWSDKKIDCFCLILVSVYWQWTGDASIFLGYVLGHICLLAPREKTCGVATCVWVQLKFVQQVKLFQSNVSM